MNGRSASRLCAPGHARVIAVLDPGDRDPAVNDSATPQTLASARPPNDAAQPALVGSDSTGSR